MTIPGVRLMYRAALAFLLAGCSPVSRIANNTNEIRTQAQLLADHGMAINDPVVVTGATRIDTLAAGIHIALGGVEDKESAWLNTVWMIAAAAIVVGVCYLLWSSGIGTFVRIAIGWLPRKKVSQAELAVDMLDPSRSENGREMIAAMRSDPEFDAAFRKAQSRRKKTP
jgi:hypothetical protein